MGGEFVPRSNWSFYRDEEEVDVENAISPSLPHFNNSRTRGATSLP